MTNYVSAVPLKELGLGLGVEHLSDEQAQELTDDFSLPALKAGPGRATGGTCHSRYKEQAHYGGLALTLSACRPVGAVPAVGGTEL